MDAAGDFNLDNVPDFIVGDAGSNNGPGRLTVHSGVDAGVLLAIGSPRNGDFGSSIAVVPDVTGDQVPEILIAAPTETIVAGLSSGRVRLYSGASGSLLKTLPRGRERDRLRQARRRIRGPRTPTASVIWRSRPDCTRPGAA